MAQATKPFSPTHNEYVVVERHALQDNIILCDTKCGILLGFSALILVWCLDKLLTLIATPGHGPISFFLHAEAGLYAAAIVAFLVTIKFGWAVIKPRISHADDYIYWGSKVFRQSGPDFILAIQNVDTDILSRDMLIHLHVLAGICRSKYANLGRAVKAAEFSRGFVFFAIALQIVAGLFFSR